MKRIITWLAVLLLWVSTTFASYSPSMALEKKVDLVTEKLISVVETKLDWDFGALITLLERFQDKVKGNEAKEWIFNTILESIKAEMNGSDEMMMKDEMMKKDEMMAGKALSHVASGKTIRWISYDWTETGEWYMMTKDGMTHVHASFMWLANPGNDNFYEGWIVRQSPLSVISTWALEFKDGKWVNMFVSDTNIDDHTFYVLTLEPNDNDPAPADHVFEGNI